MSMKVITCTLHQVHVFAVICGLITASVVLAQSVTQDTCTTAEQNNVRLVPSASLNLQEVHTGRVEICDNNLWSPICHNPVTNFWPDKNAQVVCKQLGFSGTLNSINSRIVPLEDRAFIVFDNFDFEFNCLGSEDSLADCPLGDRTIVGCTPEFEAYITCRPNNVRLSPVHQGYPREGDIRLVGDLTNGDGAVEYYRVGFGWLAVCPDSTWDDDDATVACRQLGYSDGLIANYEVPDLEGRQQIMTNFQCTPSSNPVGLGDCTSQQTVSTNTCSRAFGTFAGVDCRTFVPALYRFFGGSGSPTEGGIVEIVNDGRRWGPWCGRGWDQEDAEALCNFFGFDRASIPEIDPSIESGLKPIWGTNVDCRINTDSPFNTTSCSSSAPGGYAACSPADGFAAARCERSAAKPLSSTVGVGAVIFLASLHLVIKFF